MIIILITVVIFVLSIMGFILSSKTYTGDLEMVSIVLLTVFSTVFVIEICCIITPRVAVPLKIENINTTYNSLCARLEIINSDYEDVSKSTVIADIAEWNKRVISIKYYANNPWTNWFYCKEVVNNYKTIDYESKLNGVVNNE